MIKNLKGIMLASTVLAGTAALVPMTAYAVTQDTTVKVTVSPTITIDAATGVNLPEVSGDNIDETGKISVTVSANKAYTISLHAAQPRMYPLNESNVPDTTSSEFIPAGLPAKGTSAWGVKKSGESNYTALTTSPEVFYTASAGAQGAVTDFPVGISVAPSLSAGTYETTVTVTASTN